VPQPRHRRTVTERRASRRLPSALGVLLVAVLGVLGGVSLTATPAAAAGSCNGPLAGGQIRVVIVVDPGDSGPRGPMSTCLVVASGTSGSKILAQRASEVGLPSPRYAGSGLLCGIDGFPATDCPVNNGGAYAYWAYFNGSGGSWSYGHDNPFVRRMGDGEIMGWRFTDGSPDGAAPMPRISPSSSLFPPLTPATTATPAPAPTAAPPSGGSSAGGSGSTGGGSGSGRAPGSGPDAAGGVTGGPDATDTTVAPDEAAVDASTTSTSVESTAAATDDAADGTEELAAAPASSSGTDVGRWLGVAVVVAAVGALGVGAVIRTRSRARP